MKSFSDPRSLRGISAIATHLYVMGFEYYCYSAAMSLNKETALALIKHTRHDLTGMDITVGGMAFGGGLMVGGEVLNNRGLVVVGAVSGAVMVGAYAVQRYFFNRELDRMEKVIEDNNLG